MNLKMLPLIPKELRMVRFMERENLDISDAK